MEIRIQISFVWSFGELNYPIYVTFASDNNNTQNSQNVSKLIILDINLHVFFFLNSNKKIEEKGVGIDENEKIDWWTNSYSPMEDLV